MGGCRSIRQPTQVSFPDRGLVLIRGKNHDTGGSSGSGKSSLVQGIQLALGCSSAPATQLVGRWPGTKLTCSVEVEASTGLWAFTRGSNSVLVRPDGTEVRSAVAVADATQKVTGLTPDLLAALTYRPQRTGSAFLGRPDAGKKEFLCQVIPLLGRFEEVSEDAQRRHRELEMSSAEVLARAATLRAQHLALAGAPPPAFTEDITVLDLVVHARLLEVGRAREDVQVQEKSLQLMEESFLVSVEDQGRRVEKAEAPHLRLALQVEAEVEPAIDRSAEEKLTTRAQECARRLQRAEEADQVRRTAREQEVSAVCARLALLRRDIHDAALLEKEKNQAEAQLAHLVERRCPTCWRPWGSAEQAVDEAKRRLSQAKAGLQAVEQAKLKEKELQAYLEALPLFQTSPVVEGLRRTQGKIRDAIDAERQKTFEARQRWAESRRQRADAHRAAAKKAGEAVGNPESDQVGLLAARARAEEARGRLEKALEGLRTAESAVTTAAVRRDMARAAAASWEASVAAADKAATRAEQGAEEVVRQRDAEADFADLVGRNGFLGAIFDEILAEVEVETNEVLARIPNTADWMFRFLSETVTQKGQVKRAIKALVSVDGYEVDVSVGPSGGQRSTVDLAVDLSVLRVVERRTGASPGWLFLDEPFEGLGVIEKEAWAEVLRGHAQDKLIVVIDHASETQELFDVAIGVEYRAGETTVAA